MKATAIFPMIVGLAAGTVTARTGSAAAAGEIEPILASVDSFLERQMDRFLPPDDYPPKFADAQLIQTYDVEAADPRFGPLFHRADIYDTALAALYFIRRGDLERARRLLDGMRFVQENDPRHDGRTRVSYWANDLLDPPRRDLSIDNGQAAAGSMAWMGIALTRFYAATCEGEYLKAAQRTAEWIDEHTRQSNADGFGGFSLGEKWDGGPIGDTTKARSTEHNIGVYVFAANLYHLERKERWREMARHARRFIEWMFDEQEGKYWLGTKMDENTLEIVINFHPIPVDAQTWTALARADSEEHTAAALGWLTTPGAAMLVRDVIGENGDCAGTCDLCSCEGGASDCCYQGTRFTNAGEHIQSEMTAGAAMALWVTGQTDHAADLLCNLDRIRLTAPNHDPEGKGIVATPWCDGAPTGFASTTFPNERHVASTVWTGLALMVNNGDMSANPLRTCGQVSTDGEHPDADDDESEGSSDPMMEACEWLSGCPHEDNDDECDRDAHNNDHHHGEPTNAAPPAPPTCAGGIVAPIAAICGVCGMKRRRRRSRRPTPAAIAGCRARSCS